jgi:hypothetical protein
MKRYTLAIFAAALALSAPAQAAAIISGNATFNSATSDYTYTYSVMNSGTTDDLVLISIPVFSPLGVTNINAPMGFSLTYDMSQGWVNFIEDGSILTPETFAPGSTVGLFSFNSATAPGSAAFMAFDASGNEFSGLTAAPVPEASASLLALLAGFTAALRRRRPLSA